MSKNTAVEENEMKELDKSWGSIEKDKKKESENNLASALLHLIFHHFLYQFYFHFLSIFYLSFLIGVRKVKQNKYQWTPIKRKKIKNKSMKINRSI